MAKRKPALAETLNNFAKATAGESKITTAKIRAPKSLPVGRNTAVPLGRIVLDRYQPRPILPVSNGLREKLFSGENNWKETASLWLDLAGSDPAVGKQVNTLLEMGRSIGELKQIEPATGAWIETKDGEHKFALSTGERRFWSLALNAVLNNQEEEPQLICQEIKLAELGIQRQIIENESSKPLSAIGKARAIAGLVLERIDDLPPELDRNSGNPPTDHDYYRSVLDVEKLTGNKIMPRGIWEEIEEIMGMERSYLVRHVYLLKLPQELQQVAVLYDLPESILREILNLSPSLWERTITMAAKQGLSAAEVKKIGTGKKKDKGAKESRAAKASSRLRAFWKVTKEIKSNKEIEQIATDFAAGLNNKEILTGADILENLAKKLRLRAGE